MVVQWNDLPQWVRSFADEIADKTFDQMPENIAERLLGAWRCEYYGAPRNVGPLPSLAVDRDEISVVGHPDSEYDSYDEDDWVWDDSWDESDDETCYCNCSCPDCESSPNPSPAIGNPPPLSSGDTEAPSQLPPPKFPFTRSL